MQNAYAVKKKVCKFNTAGYNPSVTNDISFPIRISKDLKKAIGIACKKAEMSEQQLCRLALTIGIEDLKRCNYDLAAAVVDKAKKLKAEEQFEPRFQRTGLNEPPGTYKASKVAS